jgi:hypothetical protein
LAATEAAAKVTQPARGEAGLQHGLLDRDSGPAPVRTRGERYIPVSRADRATAPAKDALFAVSAGKSDGYFRLVKWSGEKGAPR